MAGFLPMLPLLSAQDLLALSATELEILREVIRREISTSPEIQALLRPKIREVYDQLRPPQTGS